MLQVTDSSNSNITKKRKALTNYRSPIYQTDLVVDEEFSMIFVQVAEFIAEVNKWIPNALAHAASLISLQNSKIHKSEYTLTSGLHR